MPSKRSENRRLTGTAFHEAGHAVAAIHFGLPFRYVTIVPDDESQSLGHLKRNPYPAWFRPDIDTEGRSERLIEKSLMVTLAGGAADFVRSGRRDHIGASGDMDRVGMLAARIYDSPFVPDLITKYVEYMMARSVAWIINPMQWVQVEAVAAALLESKTIASKQVRHICDEAAKDRAKIQELRHRLTVKLEARNARDMAKLHAMETA